MLTKESAARKDKNSAGCELQHRHFATIAAIINRMGAGSVRLVTSVHFADELEKTSPHFIAACRAE